MYNSQEKPIKVFENKEFDMQMIDIKDSSHFRCEKKYHCSQMYSCEEATFYINNCPNTKMDGNNDGIPCELQWCH
ncbi:MAG: excalibur calcium-binding domain-containing protein [Sulfurovum sp.]|nr:excalibur calcium-binding domain-containing protein [Sulfurovum sp.]